MGTISVSVFRSASSQGRKNRERRKWHLPLRPTEKIFGRDHAVAFRQKLQLASQRIRMHQIAVQSWIPDFVFSREYTMVCNDRRTGASRVAKIAAPGKSGKHNVLEGGTDESQGSPLEGFAELYCACSTA